MATKKAGTERPYTFYEFLKIIEQIAKDQQVECINELDYFSANTPWNSATKKDDPLYWDDQDTELRSDTHWGGSEGIYTCFYIYRYDKEKREYVKVEFAIAKNLGERDEDFIGMHTMAAKVSLIARNYINSHKEEFNWSGWEAGEERDGKITWHWFCGSEESAMKQAREMAASDYYKGARIVVRDNKTRKLTYL